MRKNKCKYCHEPNRMRIIETFPRSTRKYKIICLSCGLEGFSDSVENIPRITPDEQKMLDFPKGWQKDES